MSELHIIVKDPDDGDPLDMRGRKKEPRADTLTVGVKFSHRGKYYGNYLYLRKNEIGHVSEAINQLLHEAGYTAEALREGRTKEKHEQNRV